MLTAAVAVIGFLLGFKFRVPGLLVLSFFVALAGAANGIIAGSSLGAAAITILELLVISHASYLAGLASSSSLRRFFKCENCRDGAD